MAIIQTERRCREMMPSHASCSQPSRVVLRLKSQVKTMGERTSLRVDTSSCFLKRVAVRV